MFESFNRRAIAAEATLEVIVGGGLLPICGRVIVGGGTFVDGRLRDVGNDIGGLFPLSWGFSLLIAPTATGRLDSLLSVS